MNTRIMLKNELKDFSQSKKLHSGLFDFYKYPMLNIQLYEKWRLVRFLFDEILNFNIADRLMDKVNWEISLIFKNKYKCSIAHQKFGFNIYVSKETKDYEEIAKEIEKKINSVLDKSAPLVVEYAKRALNDGKISVQNKYYKLYKVYEYFKTEAIKKVDKETQNSVELFKQYNEKVSLERAGYVAFFSLLEHLYILFLPFINIPERNKVNYFKQKKNI